MKTFFREAEMTDATHAAIAQLFHLLWAASNWVAVLAEMAELLGGILDARFCISVWRENCRD